MFVWPIFANIFQHCCRHILRLSQHCLVDVRDLPEISRGGRGVENRGGSQFFLSPSEGRVMKKMTGKEGGSQEIKPPR